MTLHPLQKLFYTLALLILIVVIMHYGAFILIPVCYAVILAIIIDPMITRLQGKLKYHAVAFAICISGIILLILIPGSMVIDQLQILFSDLELEALSIDNVTKRIQETLVETKMSQLIDLDMLKEQMDRFLQLVGRVFGSILSGSGQMLINFALAIVFCYFISAYYRSIRSIILAELQLEERHRWRKIAKQAPYIIRSYLSGMLIVMGILALLNALSLYLIGLEHALVWGGIIGMLAIIPYVGTFIGLLLPLTYSFLSTNDYKQPLAILICYLIIQQIEGNLLTPKIVGDKLKVNPFIIIVMILVFGKIWGVDGVIISLPLIGVAKAVLEEYEGGQVIAQLIASKEAID